MIFLSLLLSAFIPFTTNQTVIVASEQRDSNDFETDAITTETFSGVTNVSTFVGPDAAHKIVLNSIKKIQ